MKAWMIYYRESAAYNKQYIDYYQTEGNKLNIDIELVLVEQLEFGVKNNQLFLYIDGEVPDMPDFVICRAIYPLLNKHLEYMGIKVFNNSFVSEICNDKARTYQYLAFTGIKMVDSVFCTNNLISSKMDKNDNPTVIKAVDGHGGSQVYMIDPSENEPDRESILYGLKGSDAVIQPLTGSKFQDLRVYVIGKEIIASVLRTAKKGFKSNFSLGGEVILYELSDQNKEIVNKIIDLFEFGLVGIDFIIGDESELIFNEIEDVVGSRMLNQCAPEINIVERYLRFIIRSMV